MLRSYNKIPHEFQIGYSQSFTQAIDHGSFSKQGSLVDGYESTPQNLCKVVHMSAVIDDVCVGPHEGWLASLCFFA